MKFPFYLCQCLLFQLSYLQRALSHVLKKRSDKVEGVLRPQSSLNHHRKNSDQPLFQFPSNQTVGKTGHTSQLKPDQQIYFNFGTKYFQEKKHQQTLLLNPHLLHVQFSVVEKGKSHECLKCKNKRVVFDLNPHFQTGMHHRIANKKLRDALISKKCSFFEHCSNGGGVNPCSKIMSEIVVCSGGHLTT